MSILRSLFGGNADVLGDKDFQFLLLVTALVPLGSGLLSPVLDSLIDPLGATATEIGLMISVFLAPSIVIVPLTGIFADRYGRKPLLVPLILLFGLPGTGIALTTDFHIALLLRLLQGIGWAGLTPLVVTSIGDFYAGATEATAQGLRQTGTALVGGGISLLAGAIVVIGWQLPFLVYLVAIPVGLIVFLWFDEPTDVEGTAIPREHSLRSYRGSIFGLVRQRRTLFVLIARTLPMSVWIGFATYNSIIVVRLLDGTPVQAGALYTIASLGMAIAASQVGRSVALVGSRYMLLVGANIALGAGLGAVVFAPNLLIAGVGVTAIGVGMGLTIPLYRTLLTDFAPESVRAGLVSIGSAGSRAIGVLTPIAMGSVIAVTTSIVGFRLALQLASVGVGLVGGGGGLICVLAASVAPPVESGDR